MANTQSMCTSFMGELMTATHNFGTAPTRGTSATDSFKAALYVSVADVPLVGAVPKLWVAVINSPMNEVHID